MFPRMLYRTDPTGEPYFGEGIPWVYLIVASLDECEAALADDWMEADDAIASLAIAVAQESDVLDGTVAEITATLPDMTDDQLLALEAAEIAGKTRKGLMAAIKAEMATR